MVLYVYLIKSIEASTAPEEGRLRTFYTEFFVVFVSYTISYAFETNTEQTSRQLLARYPGKPVR